MKRISYANKDTIAVDLFGRMGNQLFQYFFGYALARRHQKNILYKFSDCRIRQLSLPINEITNTRNYKKQQEKGFHFQNITVVNKTLYTGYWQSERYFKEYKKDILELMNIPMIDPESVSLHVRRGDYLKLANYHPTQSVDYYLKAAEKFKDNKIKVFSDDIEWCQLNFPADWEYSVGNDAITDFKSMASCQYHIISNSSYSWWAAWLNGQKVIAPKNWLGKALSHYKTTDLLPKTWEVI